ncbi:MAG: hypothetical protein WD794_13415 [Mycobacteriales bacterium]
MSLLLLAVVEEEDIGTGPIGLVIILFMLIATALLIRNMSGRIKRLPREFPDQDPKDEAPKD